MPKVLSDSGIDAFFRIASTAVQHEDLGLRVLLGDRSGYLNYAPGIQTAFETGVVYTIFKALLASPFSRTWTLEWESRHGDRPGHIDLVYWRKHGGRSARVGVEVKWWSKGAYGIAIDCRKLDRAASLSARFVLALHVWRKRDLGLQRMVSRLPSRPTFKGIPLRIAETTKSGTLYKEFDVLTYESELAKLGMALLAW